MNSKSLQENGTSTGLETFKSSLINKNKKKLKFLYIKFILIFLLSHSLRTLLEPTVEKVKVPVLSKDDLRIKIKAQSFLPQDSLEANLFHKEKHIEIANVKIIGREDDYYSIDINRNKVSLLLLNQEGWQFIPKRAPIKKKEKKYYEIIF